MSMRRLLFTTLLVGLSLVVSLLVAEGILCLLGIRAAGRGSPWFAGGNHPRFLFVPDAEKGYALRSGFDGEIVARSGEFRHAVSIDERGNRDHSHDAASPARILAVGDSLTFGEGVEADATYSALLEDELGVRVTNAGVPGFRSDQMAARARELLDEDSPALVVATLAVHWDMDRCRNPFVYHEGYIVAESYRDRLHLIDGNLYAEETRRAGIGPLTAHLKGRSHLARLALPPWFDLLRGDGHPEAATVPKEWSSCVEALAALSEDLDRRGSRWLVVLAQGQDDRERSLAGYARTELSEQGLDVVALDDHLAGSGARLHYPVDRHWNRDGHRWVASVLAPEIRDRLPPDLLP